MFCANDLARKALRRLEAYDKHRIVGTVTLSDCQVPSLSEDDDAHDEHCVCDLVLADTPAKNDHTRLDGCTSELIQGSNIANYVQDETRRLERMEVDHISDGAIRQGGTEDGDVVLQQAQQCVRERKDSYSLYTPSSIQTPRCRSPSLGGE